MSAIGSPVGSVLRTPRRPGTRCLIARHTAAGEPEFEQHSGGEAGGDGAFAVVWFASVFVVAIMNEPCSWSLRPGSIATQ
jgi:hypothetical protein